ncbi:MAG: hypothetical protein IJO68_08410 [Clostridia bacterium]|nr:hypothetical protein [Clostridia bacterium]MBQ9946528.1 hypothetical protein [Clostridia bacterium]
MENKWVQVWGQAHSNLSHFYYPSCEKTFRFVINSAISGHGIRLELSNEFARNFVEIGGITAALCDKDGTLLSEAETLTVRSAQSFIIKSGEVILTDAAKLSVSVGEYFAVSIFVKKGDLRSGNLLNNISLITASGEHTKTIRLSNERRKRDKVIEIAGQVLNLYLHKPLPLIQSVQVLNDTDASSVIVLGDSLSQQGFWTNRLEERIRSEYPGRYTIINKSIMGNRVLRDFSPRFPCKGLFGFSGIRRLQKDALDYPDCSIVILALGTNDFLQYGTIAAPKNEKPDVDAVFDAVLKMQDAVIKSGKKAVIINTVKFGDCIDSRPEKEQLAQKYNEKLKENADLFYAVYDQAEVLQDPDKTNCTRKEYLGNDKLHLNEKGGSAVADNFPLQLFE